MLKTKEYPKIYASQQKKQILTKRLRFGIRFDNFLYSQLEGWNPWLDFYF
jgi:hypothetical protein